jgi:biotin carboxyl carrier protein
MRACFVAVCLALTAPLALGCGTPAVRASTAAGSEPGAPPPASGAPARSETASPAADAAFRLHGTIEPVRSRMIAVPRLTGTGVGPIVIVHLAKAGTLVRAGDRLIEFDRAAQIKTANDRQAEYRDFVEQIAKKRADQATARAKDETELVVAEHAVRSAELDMLDKDLIAPIKAEENALVLEEARAKLTQLRHTFDLKRRSEAADLRILEIERDRAMNAWKHAQGNADKMQITSPIDGLVVLKTIWKNGTFGEVQEGEEVRAGQPILEVVDPSAMRVRARVNQADVDHARVGQPARIALDSYPARQFTGRLEQLSPVGSTSPLSTRVRTFIALIAIDGADPHLLPDLAAAVDLQAPDGGSR